MYFCFILCAENIQNCDSETKINIQPWFLCTVTAPLSKHYACHRLCTGYGEIPVGRRYCWRCYIQSQRWWFSTFLFSGVIVCRHKVISSCQTVFIRCVNMWLMCICIAVLRFIIQVHWDLCVIKRHNKNTKISLFFFYLWVRRQLLSQKEKQQPANYSCDYYCKGADGPACYWCQEGCQWTSISIQ